MILVIDNYDSFTFNLVQYFGELGEQVRTLRNDEIDVAGIEVLQPARIVFSPGPCTPAEAGVCVEAIRHFAGKVPMLGVCLGHQSIVEVFGGDVVRAGRLMHGKVSPVIHDAKGVFAGAPQPMAVGRYHSLIAKPETLPAVLEVTARTPEGEIMGVRHRDLMVEGVQFHPESVLTPEGPLLMGNFLKFTGGRRGA